MGHLYHSYVSHNQRVKLYESKGIQRKQEWFTAGPHRSLLEGAKHKQSQSHRIGLWEKLQESPIFDGKNHGFQSSPNLVRQVATEPRATS